MKKGFRRLEVADITFDGGSELECYDPVCCKTWIIKGSFSNYGVTSVYGEIKNALFHGVIDMQGTEVFVEVQFSDDTGIISEKAQLMNPSYVFIEANQSFAVFWHNGKKECLVREPGAEWKPYTGTLYGRIAGPLLVFSI